MAGDNYASQSQGLDSPARNAFAITPSDTATFTNYARGIYVGTSGDVCVITTGGNTVTLTGAVAGSILPVQCKAVMDTGTDATPGLVGLY